MATPLDIPRASYGLMMAAATALGLACAAGATMAAGGDARTIGLVLGVLAIASVATAIPAVLSIGREYWGVAVLACGMGRSLAVLAMAYLLGRSGVSTTPLFVGAVSGAVLILILESASAIRVLSQIERRREALKHAGIGGRN